MKSEDPEPAPTRHGSRGIAVVAAVNNDSILQRDLASSPLISEGHTRLIIERGHDSAASALNSGLDRADEDLVVFAHQDVYLPRGWERRLNAAVDALEVEGNPWAILGVAGVDESGTFAGRIYSSGLRREYGIPLPSPLPIVSLDEALIVLRKSSGLRFDESLPGFHLYGTDIVQTAILNGLGAYVFDGPIIHNSKPELSHFWAYGRTYRSMQRKWRRHLPIPTNNALITRAGLPLLRMRIHTVRRLVLRIDPPGSGHPDPVALARDLGYEAAGTADPSDDRIS